MGCGMRVFLTLMVPMKASLDLGVFVLAIDLAIVLETDEQ